ncbi:Ger(x)C family spore germination protein [Oceanobacillus halotolerans]|uniref:Ger(x)C family spore germination protein n=1 Tax=Oceanobacillus halotolerans TaxID=2663380 RepID=UPI0013DC97A3|nr:Ger(x)C family spore germination protein [Oceanobacillus halotolerans]
MRTTRIKNKVILLISMLLFLTGCWDQREVELSAYVVAIGIDKSETDEGSIRLTYLISNPEAGIQAQGSASDEPPRETITFEVDDFLTATNLANTVVAKEVTYDLLNVIIVSEELARDDRFIRWMYDATKGEDIRRNAKLLVSKENAATFIQNTQPSIETRPHQYFNLIFERGNEIGTLTVSDLLTFFRKTEADSSLFLSFYGSTEKPERPKQGEDQDRFKAGEFYYEGETNTSQFAGSAIFKEGKMIGALTAEQTRLSYLLNDTMEARDIYTTLPDPFNEDYQLGIKLNKEGKLDMQMDLKRETPTIDVTVPLKVDVLTNHSMAEYPRNPENREKLKKTFKNRFEKKFEKLITKTQDEFKGDPFAWSLHARKHFLTIPEYEKFDWMKTYPEMDISVSVDVRLGTFGRQGEVPDMEKLRED